MSLTCSFAEHGQPGIALPLYISAAGIVAAIVGTLFVRTHEKASQNDLLKVPFIMLPEGPQQDLLEAVLHLLSFQAGPEKPSAHRMSTCIVTGAVNPVRTEFSTMLRIVTHPCPFGNVA